MLQLIFIGWLVWIAVDILSKRAQISSFSHGRIRTVLLVGCISVSFCGSLALFYLDALVIRFGFLFYLIGLVFLIPILVGRQLLIRYERLGTERSAPLEKLCVEVIWSGVFGIGFVVVLGVFSLISLYNSAA